MNVKELMVGDWFAFQGRTYRCSANDIATMAECEEKGIRTDTSEVPLSVEILEKNGFEKVPQERCVNPFYWRFDKINYSAVAYKTPFRGFFFEIKNNFDCEPIVFTKQIEFVNELQHALQLCGIEKEIEL